MTPTFNPDEIQRRRLMQSLQLPTMPRPAAPDQLQPDPTPLTPSQADPSQLFAEHPLFGKGNLGDPNNAFNSRVSEALKWLAMRLPFSAEVEEAKKKKFAGALK